MRLAVVSDVHGNLPALESALSDARRNGAEVILGAGDWVGYGPFPGEVVEHLRDNRIPCISGNYDMKVLQAEKNPEPFRLKMKPFKWQILQWTIRHLNPEHLTWLAGLPATLDLEPVDGCRLHVCHGLPQNNEGRLYPGRSMDELNSITSGFPPDILVAGHTHVPFSEYVGGCLVVNTGSAGQPVDGDPRPAYCLIDIVSGRPPEARIVRFNYPIRILLSALEQTGLPAGLQEDFTHGVKRK